MNKSVHTNSVLQTFFSRKKKEASEKTKKKLERATTTAHMFTPLIATTFIVVYWMIGMFNGMNPEMQE